MSWIADPESWIALATLTAVEIVLGIDNIVVLSLLVSRLPERSRPRARLIGLSVAMGARIVLLLSLTWVMRLTAPLFTALGREISGRDLILVAGGLFLIGKGTVEIHEKLEGEATHAARRAGASFSSVILQILVLDVVFSIDSVITAIGLAKELGVMVAAVVIAVLVMMVAAGPINRFIDRHPTVKMLALAFLLLIGLALVAEGVDVHIPKVAIYFAMAFSILVEMLNIRLRGRTEQA